MKKNIINMFMALSIGLYSCEDLLRIEMPKDQTVSQDVFSNNESVNAAVAGMYRSLRDSPILSSTHTASVLTGLAGDELFNFVFNFQLDQFQENQIISNNTLIEIPWARIYNCIYQANSILEGLDGNKNIPEQNLDHFEGEAKFVRALCYFYLSNLYGNVPLITSTNAQNNSSITNSSNDEIAALIIKDLEEAVEYLEDTYTFSNGDRTRANKWAAVALLARIYLYIEDWAKAELLTTEIIDSNQYSLVELENVFISNSQESILQWARTPTDAVTEAGSFIPGTNQQPNIVCSSFLIESFENGDQRKTRWINDIEFQDETYFYPFKYTTSSVNTNESHTVLRLAEQYLIRAEARANQNKVEEAVEDINVIRNRASLGEVNQPISQDSCLALILKERTSEFFAENGHRWFDLKRLGLIDQVMGLKKPNWQSSSALFPIPLNEILRNPELVQNRGYE